MSRLHHGNRVSFHDASSPSLRIKVVELTCLLGDAFDLASTDAKSWEDAGFPVPAKGDMPPCDVVGGEVCNRARMGATVPALPTCLLTLESRVF